MEAICPNSYLKIEKAVDEMKKIVVDSSVIVKWLNREDEMYLEKADKVLSDAQNKKVRLIAPSLARYEVGNALLKKDLNLPAAFDSLGTAYNLPVSFVSETEDLAFESYEMAKAAKDSGNIKVTYYDTAFIALAKQEEATLVTDNPKHQEKIKGVKVIPLKDYK